MISNSRIFKFPLPESSLLYIHYYTLREREREREREFCGITFNLHNNINANDRCRINKSVRFGPPDPTTFLFDHDQLLLFGTFQESGGVKYTVRPYFVYSVAAQFM